MGGVSGVHICMHTVAIELAARSTYKVQLAGIRSRLRLLAQAEDLDPACNGDGCVDTDLNNAAEWSFEWNTTDKEAAASRLQLQGLSWTVLRANSIRIAGWSAGALLDDFWHHS